MIQKVQDLIARIKAPAYKKETLTVNDVSTFYNVGAIRMTVSVKATPTIEWMKKKYVVVTIGSQLLTSDLILTETKQLWKSRELTGILYDEDFPRQVEVQIYDEKHLTINNNLPTGYKGESVIGSKFSQEKLELGTYSSAISMKLNNVNPNNPETSVECTLDFEYDYDRAPDAKDKNVTSQYKLSMVASEHWFENNDSEGFRHRHQGIEGVHVILVPGLFTGAYPGYFDENVTALEKMQIVYSIAPIDTAASVRKNGQVIDDYIKKLTEGNEHMRIILMCHSKGGCDALDALANSTNEHIRRNVFGIINMQSPLNGTQFVDYLGKEKMIKKAGSAFDHIFKMSATEAVLDLSTKDRKDFMDSLRKRSESPEFDIPKMFGVHMLSFCSWADYGKTEDTVYSKASIAMMRPTNKVIEMFGQRSDGMVPLNSGRVPGGDVILVGGAYHTSPAIHMEGNPVHTGYLTLALLDTLLTLHPLDFGSLDHATGVKHLMTEHHSIFNHIIPGYIPHSAAPKEEGTGSPTTASPNHTKSPDPTDEETECG